MHKIIKVIGREILDSRGIPTVESEVHLKNGIIGTASVPSGASTGKKEAIEIRDKDPKRFLGQGVKNSVNFINKIISKELYNKNPLMQEDIDKILIKLDNTKNKSKLGANTILAVSLANAKAASIAEKIPFFKHLSILNNTPNIYSMPLPMINIINGGKHANNNIDIQEFMIQPISAKSIKQAIQMGSEIFQNLGIILKKKNISTAVGDEGGYAPNLESNEKVFELIQEAVEKSGYNIGKDISFAIDCAGSELYDKKKKKYILKNMNMEFTSKEFTNYLEQLTKKFPILSIEDGQNEEDWEGFYYQTKIMGEKIQIVGDDLFVTNTKILKKGIENKIANAILIKPNQIGTLTETINAINMAKRNNYKVIISHRSGETEDTTIADLSVGTSAGQIKTGSMSRSERIAKYNQLIRIEETLGNNIAPFNNSF